jgi:type I restriction enzyme R subunit
MYQIKSELDQQGIYSSADVDRFCTIYFKPRKSRAPTTIN